jgi:hypothetical protein
MPHNAGLSSDGADAFLAEGRAPSRTGLTRWLRPSANALRIALNPAGIIRRKLILTGRPLANRAALSRRNQTPAEAREAGEPVLEAPVLGGQRPAIGDSSMCCA